MITDESDFSFVRLCFPLISITILLTHTFLYCGAGEIITLQVSYKLNLKFKIYECLVTIYVKLIQYSISIYYSIYKCEGIYRALCNLDWYKLEPKNAKTFILLMIRASQPFRITAGKVFPLTMTTFCSVRL